MPLKSRVFSTAVTFSGSSTTQMTRLSRPASVQKKQGRCR